MNRRWILGAIAALAIVIVLVVIWRSHRAPADAHVDREPNVATTLARVDTIDVTVDAVGRLGSGSGSQAKLAFPTAGRLAAIYVHVGDAVSAGTPLASLDTSSLSIAQQQANADARAATAQAAAASVDRTSTRLAVDRQALARAQAMYAAGVVAQKEIDAARAQLAADEADATANRASAEAARAQSASAAARAAGASQDLRLATLTAPSDGVVTAVYRTIGETVDATTPVVGVAPGATAAATLQASGDDAVRIHPGDRVTMHTQGGATISGTVGGVGGAVDPVTQQADVRVRADVPASMSGTAVQATIVVSRDRGVIVPRDAVVTDPATGATLAFVLGKDKDGRTAFAQRAIHVIYQNSDRAEITGVRPGERVASRGTFELLAPASGGD